MSIKSEDIKLLCQGQPPDDYTLLDEMTLGHNAYLDFVEEHYLKNYILSGGSKVKLLVGPEGWGKTHLLRFIQNSAEKLGYQTVFISLQDQKKPLNIVDLYKQCASSVDQDLLSAGLCQRVGKELGYSEDKYKGDEPILPTLIEEGLTRGEAIREIRKAVKRITRESDLSPSFNVFIYNLLASSLIGNTNKMDEICWKWFKGEKLEYYEKKSSHLFDKLNRINASVWLYSLIRLVQLSSSSGLVLLIDNLDAITQRDPETQRYRCTPNVGKDIYELFRQLVDATELLEYFFVLIAGRPEILSDERRGLKSYEALWMRLQTGLISSEHFNRFADMVDIERLIRDVGGIDKFAKDANDRLREIIEKNNLDLKYKNTPSLKTESPLRQRLSETANMITKGGEDVNL
ncbi:DUF2791 family P-loop domain-containing protein [bacterium]|nr:DUF2791 family P-loop domain-containing protein [bacterium]